MVAGETALDGGETTLDGGKTTFGSEGMKQLYSLIVVNPRSPGGGSNCPPPAQFFLALKFLLLDRLSKPLAQLFLVC